MKRKPGDRRLLYTTYVARWRGKEVRYVSSPENLRLWTSDPRKAYVFDHYTTVTGAVLYGEVLGLDLRPVTRHLWSVTTKNYEVKR